MDRPTPATLSPAKVSRPRGNGPLVRPRLFDRLDALRRAPVAWVAGPPGSGKTTLLSSYLSARGIAGPWIQLAADDADIATFFYYLGLAVEHAENRGGPGVPSLLPAFVPGLAAFTQRCAAAIALRFDRPAAIVLDNYEQIPADAPLHAIVRELATALPEGLGLIVLSRGDPPAAYARLRLHEGLAMLEAHELNLTRPEALAVVAMREPERSGAAGGGGVDPLLRLTEGWFAGFNLLLAEGRGAGPPEPRGRTQQLLFDYFAAELFEQIEPGMQAALLRTALLPAMTAADAERVCGDAAIGPLLSDLHRRNCFVLQRGAPEPRYAQYEYHALFRAFLMDRAAARLPAAEWRALHCRSADVLAQAGQADAAAALYRAAGAWPPLAALALREASALVAAGRHRTLEHWLAGLPDDAFCRSPWLRYWHAEACLPFDPVAARGLFEQAYAGFERDDDAIGLYTTWAGAMESFFFEWRDFRPADRWIDEFDTLRARHPQFPSRAIELRSYCAMGTLLHRQPEHPMLPAWAERAKDLLAPADRDPSALLGGYLIIWHLWRGEAAEARGIVDRIGTWAGAEMSPMVQILWSCAVGFFHSVRGDTAPCRQAIEAGLAVAAETGLHAFDFLLAAQMARCCLVAGEAGEAGGGVSGGGEADAWIAKMAGAMRSHSHIDGAFYQHLLSSAAVQRGRWQLALDHGRGALAMALDSGVPFIVAACRISLARAHLAGGESEAAGEHVAAARAIGKSMKSRVVECHCLEIEARVAFDGRRLALARDRLAAALALSRTMDGATWNMAGPAANARLYQAALDADIESDHVRRLIRRFGLCAPEPAAAAAGASNWPWPIRVYTLGRFDVVLDDRPARAAGKPQQKPLELLKCLCAFGGSAVRQERLMDALWPDAEGDAAEQALRTTLHRLRKLLHHVAALRLEDRQLHLDPRWLWADCLEFEQAANLARPDDRAALQAALGLYRGHFLHDESAPWAIPLRARLRARFMSLAERLGSLLERDGDSAGAIGCYLQVLEVEPLAQAFYRRLMTAHERLGDRSEALSVYRRCRQALLAIEGVSPGPEMQALHRRLSSPSVPDR